MFPGREAPLLLRNHQKVIPGIGLDILDLELDRLVEKKNPGVEHPALLRKG